MDSKTYIDNATRTESLIHSVEFGTVSLHALMGACIVSAELIDMAKKNIFYGKQIDADKWSVFSTTLMMLGAMLDEMRTREHVLKDDEDGLAALKDCLPNISLNNLNPRLLHAAIGLTTESAEILKAISSQFEGAGLDAINVAEEIGDLEWYKAIALDELGADEAQIRERNIAKLKARFPNKFEASRAINRDLDAERSILEGNA